MDKKESEAILALVDAVALLYKITEERNDLRDEVDDLMHELATIYASQQVPRTSL